MYQARVYKVMIATPGDVAVEREVVRKAVHRWNALLADHHKLVLLPVGWDTHSHPEMGQRPQAVINKKVLKDCDLLVAVFWTRLGSPTGEAPSGTVEEIEEHLKAGKPAMIYFSTRPFAGTPWTTINGALPEFRAECQSRGLVHSYDMVADFAEKFGEHVISVVIEKWIDSRDGDVAMDAQRQMRGNRPVVLSDDAWALLREAAEADDCAILQLRTMAGTVISTNQRTFVEGGNPKTEARWESAVRELAEQGLIQDRGHKGEVLAVTHKGYAAAQSATP